VLAATSSVLLLRTDGGGGGTDSRSDRARTGGVGRRETSGCWCAFTHTTEKNALIFLDWSTILLMNQSFCSTFIIIF